MKRIMKMERLLYELWQEVRKAKPLMSKEEALSELHELRCRRAERFLGLR